MIGNNTLIINREEMLRAISEYFKKLVWLVEERGNTKVLSVRQKGAPFRNDFIIELIDEEK